MKKLLALLIIVSALLSLASCGNSKYYDPVESTAEEKQAAIILKIDNKEYTVKYELYRALFLTHKSSVDGGDNSVWNSENKNEYISKIEEIIIRQAAEIYSVLHHAEKIGIKVYSKDYDTKVKEYVKESVNTDFESDYSKYLEYLKENGMNYSVQDLFFRYYFALEDIYVHYAGNIDGGQLEGATNGTLQYTRDDVLAFYNSDECVQVMRAYKPKLYITSDGADAIREKMIEKAASGETAIKNYIISESTTGNPDVCMVIGAHSEDKMYYYELTEAAFELNEGEVSPVIEVSDGNGDAYIILYRFAKSEKFFADNYESIRETFVQNKIGEFLDPISSALTENATYAPLLETLDRASISMG